MTSTPLKVIVRVRPEFPSLSSPINIFLPENSCPSSQTSLTLIPPPPVHNDAYKSKNKENNSNWENRMSKDNRTKDSRNDDDSLVRTSMSSFGSLSVASSIHGHSSFPSSSTFGTDHPSSHATTHNFDGVYGPLSNSVELYKEYISPIVDDVLDGYPATVFAYGHTGSGKTYTMSGGDRGGSRRGIGIVQMAVRHIFDGIQQLTKEGEGQGGGTATGGGSPGEVIFLVKVCYVELYNNQFRDLLSDNTSVSSNSASTTTVNSTNSSNGSRYKKINPAYKDATGNDINNNDANIVDGSDIKIRSHPTHGIFLSCPSHQLHHPTTTAEQALSLIERGMNQRQTRTTKCNDHSSRSHTVLTITVESQLKPNTQVCSSGDNNNGSSSSSSSSSNRSSSNIRELRLGRLHLVDLAGSERLSASGVSKKSGGLRETTSINLSLSALGNVLSALSRNSLLKRENPAVPDSELSQVPYRDSKLTHLLKDSLGGNSKTLMICTVRDGNAWYQQTGLSLMYACRARNITTRSRVNRDVYGRRASTGGGDYHHQMGGGVGGQSLKQISGEIDILRGRLGEREREFQELTSTTARSEEENKQLKARLIELETINERERRRLENELGKVIFDPTGSGGKDGENIGGAIGNFDTLQRRVKSSIEKYREKVEEQKAEIGTLRKTVASLEMMKGGEVVGVEKEMEEMGKVLEMWQCQATEAQGELVKVSKQYAELTKTHQKVVGDNENEQQQRHQQLLRQRQLEEEQRQQHQQHLLLLEEKKKETTSLQQTVQRQRESLKKADALRHEDAATIKQMNDNIAKLSDQVARCQRIQSSDASKIKKLTAELTQRNGDNQDVIAQLEGQLAIAKQQLSHTTETVTNNIADIQLQFADVLAEKDKQIDDSRCRLREVEDTTKAVIADLTKRLSLANGAKEENKQAMNAIKNAMKVERAELAEKLSSKEKNISEMKEERSRVQEKNASLLKQYSQRLEDARMKEESVNEELEITKSLLRESIQAKDVAVREARETGELAVKEEKKRGEDAVTSAIESVKKDFVSQLAVKENQLGSAIKAHADEVTNLRSHFEKELKLKDSIHQETSEANGRIASEKLQDLEIKLQEKEKESDRDIKEVNKVLLENKLVYEEQVAGLIKRHEEETASLVKKQEEELANVRATLASDYHSDVVKTTKDAVCELERQHSREVGRLQDTISSQTEEFAAITNKFKDDIELTKRLHGDEIGELNASLASAQVELRGQIEVNSDKTCKVALLHLQLVSLQKHQIFEHNKHEKKQ